MFVFFQFTAAERKNIADPKAEREADVVARVAATDTGAVGRGVATEIANVDINLINFNII